MFAAESIPYELVGGLAVAVQLERVAPDEVMLTRDVDIMVYRSDLDRIQEAAARHGFHFRHTAGLDMLLYGDEKSAVRGIHLIFSGESVKTGQAPNPDIAPEPITIYGQDVAVVSVADLVRMKLNSYRDKDRVHLRALDAVGLITPEIDQNLSAELQSRLRNIRATE